MDLILSGEILVMSSIDIAKEVNKTHRHVMRDIKKQLRELDLDESNYGHTYIDSQKREQPCFLLDKELCLVLASGYNTKMRLSIIQKWTLLEEEKKKESQPVIPQTKLEWMQLAVEQETKLIEQQVTITEQAPKVDFYNDVTGSSDTVDMGQVAKVLNMGIGRNKMFQFLRDKSVLQRNNQPYQTYVDRGFFRIIESSYSKPDGSSHINLKTVVYQKGLDFIRRLLKRELA